MDILTNLQEYGVIGAAFTIVLIILKYNGKQGWKESLGLSDREKFFHLFLQTLTITTIMQFTFLCLADKIMSIIAYIDIIIFVAALLFRMILDCAVINMICLLGFIVFGGVMVKVSGKKEYKHQYAIIFLTNGEKLQNIEVTTILTKGKWIACSDLDRNIEYRIRRRDIIRVKYYNK